MKNSSIRIAKLLLGLFLYALSITLGINANLGMAPWELFHTGLAQRFGFSYGQVTVFCSVIIVIADVLLLKERIGLGTLANMILVGTFVDMINVFGIVPVQGGLLSPLGYIQHLLGMICVSFAMYFYMSAGYGLGPRDGLFIGISKKFKISTKLAKTITEVGVFIIGVMLGAQYGIGTALFAFLSGPVLQMVCKLIKFDLNGVKHSYIDDTFRNLEIKKKPIQALTENMEVESTMANMDE